MIWPFVATCLAICHQIATFLSPQSSKIKGTSCCASLLEKGHFCVNALSCMVLSERYEILPFMLICEVFIHANTNFCTYFLIDNDYQTVAMNKISLTTKRIKIYIPIRTLLSFTEHYRWFDLYSCNWYTRQLHSLDIWSQFPISIGINRSIP